MDAKLDGLEKEAKGHVCADENCFASLRKCVCLCKCMNGCLHGKKTSNLEPHTQMISD